MKPVSILLFVMFLSASASAMPTYIVSELDESEGGGIEVLYWDEKANEPVSVSKASHSTIKDFREDASVEACWSGDIKLAEKMVDYLVAEADGDGDSFVTESSVYASGTDIVAEVTIISEAGEEDFDVVFEKCE